MPSRAASPAGVFGVAIVCDRRVAMCLLALEPGGDHYPWNSSTIIGLLCGASSLFCFFLIWEHHKGGTATIPLMMFRGRVVSLGCSTMFLQFGALLLLTYWLPIWFQVVKGEGPDMSGVMILPILTSQALSSTISGKLVSTVGHYTPFALEGVC
jgi:hypothetical protein